jgi:hypothetical protein
VRVVITGSSGLIGSALCRSLEADNHVVIRLVRRQPRERGERAWDPAAAAQPHLVDGADAVVNLAGATLRVRRAIPGRSAARWNKPCLDAAFLRSVSPGGDSIQSAFRCRPEGAGKICCLGDLHSTSGPLPAQDPLPCRRREQEEVRPVGRGASELAAGSETEGAVIGARPRPAIVPSLVSPRGHVVVPRVGLRFPARLPFEAWVAVGRQLSAVATSSAWCLGDWLAYGQDTYRKRYEKAVEGTGLDYQTLRNYVWVARRFELSRRREMLSFGHHAEVASLREPEQDFWLRKAEELGWSTSRLRQQVRASLAERTEQGELEPAADSGACGTGQSEDAHQPVTVRLHLTAEQAKLCQMAADRQSLTVPTWAVQVLGHAAYDSLELPASP